MVAFRRRGFLAGALVLALAACKVVPDSGRPGPAPAPAPTPTGPSDTVLPTDTARHRIALLVPLSGENADVGRSIANAATMAVLDTNAQNLRITTYDTAAGVSTAVADALKDGNKLILGPLLREDIGAVVARARPAKVPLITFSNDLSVAAPDVFVMGQAPEQSIDSSVDYLWGKGARRFAALVPEGEYGRRAGDAFARSVARAGGVLAATETYDRDNTSIISAADRLRTGARADAVLIADGTRLAAMAATSLARSNPKPSLMGTELWSGDADLTGSAPLRGAIFSSVSDARFRQFSTSYQSRFGTQPYRLATLGYDAVLLTLRVARDWQPGRNFPEGRLLAADGFLGLDGLFRFTGKGVSERAMEVRQVGNGTVTVVSPAITKFD